MYKCNCGKQFEKQRSLNSHARFCNLYVKKKSISSYKLEENLYQCECGKQFHNSQGLNGHLSFCLIHRNGIKYEKRGKGNASYFEGKRGWSKGLTKDTDKRVEKNREIYVNNIKNGKTKPSFLGKHHSEETKNKLSLAQIKYLENTPHVKWYIVNNGKRDIKVQGKWEKNVAEWLNEKHIKWDRITLKYSKTHRYTPDFYLVDLNEYLEVKGWLREIDKIKMRSVIFEHKIKIKIIYQKEYRHLKDIDISSLKYFE